MRINQIGYYYQNTVKQNKINNPQSLNCVSLGTPRDTVSFKGKKNIKGIEIFKGALKEYGHDEAIPEFDKIIDCINPNGCGYLKAGKATFNNKYKLKGRISESSKFFTAKMSIKPKSECTQDIIKKLQKFYDDINDKLDYPDETFSEKEEFQKELHRIHMDCMFDCVS